jgi:two-component system, NarL family, response regulator NreC
MSIRVLLADDHAMMRDGLQALLQAAPDIEVAGSASNGREALRLAAELQPDVVVMDIAMPDLNGIEALGLLRRKHPQTRVLMLSMHSSSEHVHRALNAGAAGYMLKESAGEEIVTAIRAVHAGRAYLSRALATMERHAAPRGNDSGPLASLSSRERQVLQLVVEGRSSSEIAALLHLSPKSVDTYRSRLMKKLGIDNISGLVKFAVQHGLTPPG